MKVNSDEPNQDTRSGVVVSPALLVAQSLRAIVGLAEQGLQGHLLGRLNVLDLLYGSKRQKPRKKVYYQYKG